MLGHNNKAIGVVLIAQSGLACAYLAAIHHIIGEQSGIAAVDIEANHKRSEALSEIAAAVQVVDKGGGVILVTDMHGGSPFNLATACARPNCRILSGMNLPMVIKLMRSRGLGLDNAIERAVAAAHKYIQVH